MNKSGLEPSTFSIVFKIDSFLSGVFVLLGVSTYMGKEFELVHALEYFLEKRSNLI